MPKWWTDRAKHIREKNPSMSKGEEWAIATNQYKKEFGHPPRRHQKSSIGDPMSIIDRLVSLANALDEKQFHEEADMIDRVIVGQVDGSLEDNLLVEPSIVKPQGKGLGPLIQTKTQKPAGPDYYALMLKQVLDSSAYKLAISVQNFQAAKEVIMSIAKSNDKIDKGNIRVLESRIEAIEGKSNPVAELQRYMYNAWLARTVGSISNRPAEGGGGLYNPEKAIEKYGPELGVYTEEGKTEQEMKLLNERRRQRSLYNPSLEHLRENKASLTAAFDRENLSSVIKNKILDNPAFNQACAAGNFTDAKTIAVTAITETPDAGNTEGILNAIMQIETVKGTGNAAAKELQRYMYNAWLKYIGKGVIAQLLSVADKLDEQGLFIEADQVTELVKESWTSSNLPLVLSPSNRPLVREVPVVRDPGTLCPECGNSVFNLSKPCSQCGRVGEEKDLIEEL